MGSPRALAARVSGPSSEPVIGVVTTYCGTELPYLRGYTVRVIAVLKAGVSPDEADRRLTDEQDIARLQIYADDRIEVAPWLAAEGRYSFVTCDPLACDLSFFAHLRGAPCP